MQNAEKGILKPEGEIFPAHGAPKFSKTGIGEVEQRTGSELKIEDSEGGQWLIARAKFIPPRRGSRRDDRVRPKVLAC